MARQKGVIKLKGPIGDVSFYKTSDGYFAREKGGVSAERIKTDPAFQRTRENGSEFGRAGRGGRILRNSLSLLLQNAADNRMTSRLTKEMVKVVKSDLTNIRGERTLQDGDISLLVGFDFNARSKLVTAFYTPYVVAIDRAGGVCTLDVADFIPENAISFPQGATHFKLVIGAAEASFPNETFEFSKDETAEMPLDQTPTGNINLSAAVPAGSNDDLFMVVGIEFKQQVNGVMYPMKNGAYNPLALVAVDRV